MSNSENPLFRRFESSRLWEFNVYAAIIIGLGGGVVMCVVAGILISIGGLLIGSIFILNGIACLLLLYPGNLAVAFPYAVEVEHGKGLRLFGPMKAVYIPLSDVKEVCTSFLAFGWSIKLKKGQRLLTAFTIPLRFGPESKDLVGAIEQEINRWSLIPK